MPAGTGPVAAMRDQGHLFELPVQKHQWLGNIHRLHKRLHPGRLIPEPDFQDPDNFEPEGKTLQSLRWHFRLPEQLQPIHNRPARKKLLLQTVAKFTECFKRCAISSGQFFIYCFVIKCPSGDVIIPNGCFTKSPGCPVKISCL
jgi:hypothetical protein